MASASIRGPFRAEVERITRRYTSEIGIVIDPDKDIPAPDIGTDQQTMAWMMDTYSVNVGYTASGEDDFWQLECEYFVPAALEGQVTPERACKLRARIVVEGANGQTTPAADDILSERNILVIPDMLANSGGVTVSCFEWVQDFSSFFWREEETNVRLESIMIKAFDAIWQLAQERGLSIRAAAFIIACQRVPAAREQRGLYP